jgi:hypothetical protein
MPSPAVSSAVRSAHGLTVLETMGDECVVSAWKNVTVVVWRASATLALVNRLSEVTHEFLRGHPEGFSNVHVVTNGTKLPTPDGRAALERLTQSVADQMACAAVVLEGRGFWASAISSVVVGIQMVSRGSYSLRIHANTEAVARWLPKEHERRTKVALEPAELLAVLEEARA